MDAVSAHEISKFYDGKAVLNRVSFSVRCGEVIGLLGPNGAGKTTFLKMAAGLVRADAGQMRIFGDSAAKNRAALRRRVALVPQECNLERECTVYEALYLYARLFGLSDAQQRIRALVDNMQIADWAQREIGQLSGGMRRRILIARAMLADPELILLDEPTVGLDPDMRREVWQMVRRLQAMGKTVVLTTHYMDEAESLCERIAFFRSGELAALDTVDGIREKTGNARPGAGLEELFLLLSQKEGA